MKAWRDSLISASATILDAIQMLDKTGIQICLVVDGAERLLGTITDGDIRRGILRSIALTSPVSDVMNSSPIVGALSDSSHKLLEMMNVTQVREIPIVDDRGVLIGLSRWSDLSSGVRPRDNLVVLMAGGLGSRLQPLTTERPKPLLNVGHKPLLETILENLVQSGFRRFYIAVNYMADMVKSHFGDGRKWDCEISYLEERAYLGTAGALGLLETKTSQPIVVMNGDVLTKINFENLLDFHREQRSKATMCVREYRAQIPYGVVEIAGNRIRGIIEKPIRTDFVNAGIYVLNASVLEMVRGGEKLDMTDLFSEIIEQGDATAAFPIWEYWIDIGRIDDFEKANVDYMRHFRS